MNWCPVHSSLLLATNLTGTTELSPHRKVSGHTNSAAIYKVVQANGYKSLRQKNSNNRTLQQDSQTHLLMVKLAMFPCCHFFFFNFLAYKAQKEYSRLPAHNHTQKGKSEQNGGRSHLSKQFSCLYHEAQLI